MMLIGKRAMIHPHEVEGTIVDETKNTIKVRTPSKDLVFEKKQITIEINGKLIDGKSIAKRPYDRIKEK